MGRDALIFLAFIAGLLGLLFGWPMLQDRLQQNGSEPLPPPPPLVAERPQSESDTPQFVGNETPAGDDPELEMERPEVASDFLSEVLDRAESDPEAAMNWVTDIGNHGARVDEIVLAIEAVTTLWAEQEPEAALGWIENNLEITRLDTISTAVGVWAEKAPAAAAEWIAGMASDGALQAASSELAKHWGSSDPASASAWLDTLPSGPVRDSALDALVEGWSKRNLPEATLYALDQARDTGKREPYLKALGQLTVSDDGYGDYTSGLNMALDLVRNMPAGALADESTDAVLKSIVGLSANDSLADMILIEEAISSPQTRMFPEQEPERLAQTFMREWARSDSVAASAKLASLDAGPVRDGAIAGFADTMVRFEPQAAAEWVNTISDPSMRANQLDRVVQEWAQRQPVEAIQWVKQADLDPAMRSALASGIPFD